MVDPEDLLGKADALMARHRPARPGGETYPEIPVLEDVVDLAPEESDLPVLTESVEPERIGSPLPEPAPPTATPAAPQDANMRAALLAALQPEIDALIEARLKENLEPLVERLFTELRGELQLIARDTLSKAINTAVRRELVGKKSDA